MLKICIVNEGFSLGGVERVTIEIANSLQEKGHSISLVDFSGKNNFYYKVNENISLPLVIKNKNILKKKITRKLLTIKQQMDKKELKINKIYNDQLKDLIGHLKNQKTEVLILCQGLLTALIPFIKAEIPSIKIIAWQHNEYDIYTEKYYANYLQMYFLGLSKADLVVCLTKKDIKNYKKHNNNTINIYNPLTITTQKISELKNKRIIFVGRLAMYQKGLDFLIEIAKKIEKDWSIHVAGDGNDKSNFINLIKDNNLEDKIKLVGSLTSEDLVNFYSSGSIFISTSRWEGFGLVITEAMACGLPIISFNNFGPEEILNNGEYGILIENNNIIRFIEKLELLEKSMIERERLQTLSLKRVKDFYIDNIIDKWEDAIESI